MTHYYDHRALNIKGKCRYEYCLRRDEHIEEMEYMIYPELYHKDCYISKLQHDITDKHVQLGWAILIACLAIFSMACRELFQHMSADNSSQHVHTSG